MNRLEDELKLALRREEPSSEFSDRVMTRIAELQKQEKAREKAGWLRMLTAFFRPTKMRWAPQQGWAPQLRWAMAGAMAVALIVTGIGVQRIREREREKLAQIEGERAKEQVMLAFGITSAKLNMAQKKVIESANHENESK